MGLSQFAAVVFLPVVLPICFYVAFTDLREMRITNQAVIVLAVLFVPLGLIALPGEVVLWRIGQGLGVLAIGFLLNLAGAFGAGDAKFTAAAAPYIAPKDTLLIVMILSACLLAAVATHRLAKHSALRNLAPDWKSWTRGKDFPMGLALGATLAAYLGLGVIFGT